MKKKGFTLIELLVVIAIIAMLMAILMPALGRVRRLAQRLICGTNLKGLGQACMIYANENDEEFPVAGGKGLNTWATKDAQADYWDKDNFDWSNADAVTVSASLYLLIREADVSPKQFVCQSSDQKVLEVVGADQGSNGQDLDITEMWDFGGKAENSTEGVPRKYVSYAYQVPYQVDSKFPAYPLNASSAPGMAVMADKSPWSDSKLTPVNSVVADADKENYLSLTRLIPDDWTTAAAAQKWKTQTGNSAAHLREGQNVLFMDSHVEFTNRSDVGVRNDNIYCTQKGQGPWTETDIRQGAGKLTIGNGQGCGHNDSDSYLTNDDQK